MDLTNLARVTVTGRYSRGVTTYTATEGGFNSSRGGFFFASEVEAIVAKAMDNGADIDARYSS